MVLTKWNLFVKKIFHEGRRKNSSFKFKDALKEASKRKSEMTTSSMTPSKRQSKSLSKTRKRRPRTMSNK